MNVKKRDDQVGVRGVQLGSLSLVSIQHSYGACSDDNRRTGVTRRGVSRTYSAKVGSWTRYSKPLDDRTIWRGCLPMMLAWSITPRWVCVVFAACSFRSVPSCDEESFLSRSRTTSPSLKAWCRAALVLKDLAGLCVAAHRSCRRHRFRIAQLASSVCLPLWWSRRSRRAKKEGTMQGSRYRSKWGLPR